MTDRLRALTVWQPWATLIALGLKRYEWRRWPCPGRMVGRRIVIHAGKHLDRDGLYRMLASQWAIEASCGPDAKIGTIREVLDRAASNPSLLPLGAGLCTVRLGKPKRAGVILQRHGFPLPDGERGDENFGWPLMLLRPWVLPVPAKGAQGLWNWTEGSEDERNVRRGAGAIQATARQRL